MAEVAARRTAPAKCAGCERPLETPLFCGSCRRLYPADGMNYFELLGLSPRYDLDLDAVRRKYFALARDIHPDRIVSGTDDMRQLSMRVSAKVNRAYQVLLDPLLRAEYLLELAGGKSGQENKLVPPDVLAETFALREEIEEATGDEAALTNLRLRIQERFHETQSEIEALAVRLPGDEHTRSELRGRLNAVRYFQKMLEQL